MKKISKDTVKYVAHLARIELKEKELESFALQLEDILDFIGKLKKVNIDKVKPMSHVLGIENVLRDDKRKESLSSDQALEGAPRKDGKFFVVPKVIE